MKLHSPASPRVLLIPLIAMLPTFAGCSWSLHERQVRLELDHMDSTSLDVLTENGAIEVRASEDDRVHVLATIRASSKERAEGVRIEAERDGDGTLRVRPLWPDGRRRNREGCGFEVRLPAVHGVVAKTSNGSIEAWDVDGDLVIDTSNGKVRAERVRGALRAKTSNGSIRIREAAGTIQARTSNGGVLVQASPGNAGPFEIRSSNGNVTLHAPDFGGALELATSNGRVSFDEDSTIRVERRGRDDVLLVRGDSTLPSSIRTSNGSVRASFAGLPTEATSGETPASPKRRSF